MSPAPIVVVHGGAGSWGSAPSRLRDALAACEAAAQAGFDVLRAGGNALDAVEAAVRALEDAPSLNAGRGAYPNRDGDIELDAMIMDGGTLGLGAAAAVRRVANPVSLARRVMEDSGHTFLVGAGAESFADDIGFPRCETADLLVDRTGPAADTVGAVALDQHGDLAAATSTGGIPGKRPGRVGDSPLAGCGAYADNSGAAVSATGDGEDLMRIVISKLVSDAVVRGESPQSACERAISVLGERTGGNGGLIALDAAGRPGIALNTHAMPWAIASDDRVETGHAAPSGGG